MAVKTAVATHADYPIHLHMTEKESEVVVTALNLLAMTFPFREAAPVALEIRDELEKVL